jgi:hypothetical protein
MLEFLYPDFNLFDDEICISETVLTKFNNRRTDCFIGSNVSKKEIRFSFIRLGFGMNCVF